jgi:dihydroorotase
MGVPLEEVIRRSTVNPGREIHHPELGTLSVGSAADIAVLQELHGEYSYADDGYARMDGTVKLVARMTIRGGRILYDPSGLSMVEWHHARRLYFHTPTTQDMRRATADDYPRN